MKEIRESAPVGRRALSEKLNQSERTLRTETDFLRKNGIISSSKAGMTLTLKGKKILFELEQTVDQFMKMNEKEEELAKRLKLQLCRIIPETLMMTRTYSTS